MWKTTVLMPTGQAPVECLIWSLLSLFLRSDVNHIDQVVVHINGPDPRTGNVSLQDLKQSICEKIKALGYPINVLRTWSRVGFAPAIQSMLPFVKTDSYVLMHDDVIVLNNSWQEDIYLWKDTDISAIISPPVLDKKLTTTVFTNTSTKTTTITYLPAINTTFCYFKKNCNISWNEYQFSILDKKIDIHSINSFYENKPKTFTMLGGKSWMKRIKDSIRIDTRADCQPERLQYDAGAWIAYKLINDGKVATFGASTHHLKSMNSRAVADWEVHHPDDVTCQLIDEIKHSKFKDLYEFKVKKFEPSADLRPLVCVIVYDRLDCITQWVKAWKTADKYNSKLLIVQNVDNSKRCEDLAKAIADLEPDYHWIRKNDKQSTKHWFELLDLADVDFDWNVLVPFTDDCIPLRKDFLMPLLAMFENPKLGLTGGVLANYERHQIADPKYFQRSICLAMRKQLLVDIRKDAEARAKTGWDFSVACELEMWNWAKLAGYEIACTNHDWSLIHGWDCHNQGINDLWETSNFNLFGDVSRLYSFS